jgi:hypothetical protein
VSPPAVDMPPQYKVLLSPSSQEVVTTWPAISPHQPSLQDLLALVASGDLRLAEQTGAVSGSFTVTSSGSGSKRGEYQAMLTTDLHAPHLLPTLERIDQFAGLEPGWNGEGAPQLPGLVVSRAALLVLRVAQSDTASPLQAVPITSAPIADGGLQLEWESSDTRIEVQVAPDGTYGYSLIHLGEDPISVEAADNLALNEVVELVQHIIRP